MRRLLVLLPLLVFVAAGVWLTRGVGWDTLAHHQQALRIWVGTHPLAAACAYLLAYIATAALSLPHGAVLTATGGLLFGAGEATALTAIGATTGATLLLVLLRSLMADTLRRQQQRIPQAMRMRLARDGLSYLLFVRLLPVFPFWLVNLAAAVVGLRLRVFIPGTLIGGLPVIFIVASIGAGLAGVLAAGRPPDFLSLFSPHILLPLVALAALSLLPALLRWRTRHA
jgi:uncharacterized membrane protein YdjX (TVP38/TMEM64 family)